MPASTDNEEKINSVLSGRDAPFDEHSTAPSPREAADNLSMAREILDAYQRGDDRTLVIGWAVRLASHLLFAASSHHAMKEALEAWLTFDREPFHFDDQRYLDLAAKARALTATALSRLTKEI